MTYTNDDVHANVYDYVPAHAVEENDFIAHETDLIEVKEIIDSGDSIMVKGYSHVTGDSVTYIIKADQEVGLWTV